MTHPLMQRLHDDHRNFRQILELLVQEVDRLDALTEDERDLDLIAEVMQYMVHYADRFHHPLEDEVYELLAKHDRSDAIAQLEREHVDLERLGEDLLQRAHFEISMAEGWDRFAADLRGYASNLATHKDLEEEKVFPLAKVLLKAKDFDAIQGRFAWLDDPVFGGGMAQGYKVLGERLLRRAATD